MATKIYQLRDQHQGVLAAYSWSEPPTAEQLAPILASLGGRVLVPGPQHANAYTEEQLASPEGVHAGRGRGFVIKTELHGPGDVVTLPATSEDGLNRTAAVPLIVGSGVGTVG